jgi:hypothetical protein
MQLRRRLRFEAMRRSTILALAQSGGSALDADAAHTIATLHRDTDLPLVAAT